MALSLCIGLLIDDAIVVRENIVRHADMGKSHRHAALEGTSEIGLAVMATTFAHPRRVHSGRVHERRHRPSSSCRSASPSRSRCMVSLFVSFTLDPMLSSVWAGSEARAIHVRVPWLGKA